MNTEEKKIGPRLKAFKAKTNVKTDDGYNETWDIASGQPNAKKPATPIESILTTIGAMSRYAVMYANQGADAVIESLDKVKMAWDWKSKNGYIVEPDPRMKVLNHLADQLGFHLVPQYQGAGKARFDEALQRDVEETRDGADYVKKWDEFWKDLCTNEDGTLNLDAIQRELADYSVLIGFSSHVIDHVTGGRVSKPLTWPSVICTVADDRVNELVEDATKDLQDELDRDTQVPWVRRDHESVYCTMLLVDIDVPIGVIPHWTDEQVKQAEDWALAVHYKASDNDDVEVPPFPEFLAPYRAEAPADDIFKEPK